MEFDKDFLPRPHEVKALRHVNKVSLEDMIAFGFVYDTSEEHHRYSGYINGYEQAVKDAQKILSDKGIKIDLDYILIYGVS